MTVLIYSRTYDTDTGSARTGPSQFDVGVSGQSLLKFDSQFRIESIQSIQNQKTNKHTRFAHAAHWANAFQLWNK